MNRRRSRLAPALSGALEGLEGRMLLTGIGSSAHPAEVARAAEVASRAVHTVKTSTSLGIQSGTLGQPITFSVVVRGPKAAGAPQGKVNIVDHGRVLGSLTLTPSATSKGRVAVSTATGTLNQIPGGSAYYFGKHPITAEFVPAKGFAKSRAAKTFTVTDPKLVGLSDGVGVQTIVPGTGTPVQSGQTVAVLYTGYLEKTGQIFDDSVNDGGTPISFTLGTGQVVPGFDAGIQGMQVGESRIIVIPPSQGYGATANGSIPANSTLIFVATLESIS